MLKSLYIKNIAIIDVAKIEFTPGLCVLSGETGAGKSIIIDSINTVTGSRASRELIRTSENSATVAALFTDIPKKAEDTAKKLGIEVSDGSILLRREVFASGHNVCHINGQPATIPMLKELGAELIAVHGQHDGLYLLDEARHIDYLDLYAGNQPLLDKYLTEYEALLSLNKRIKALSLSESEKAKRLEYVELRLQELEKAELSENEWEELKERREKLKSAEKTAKAITEILSELDGTDEKAGACAELSRADKLLSGSKNPILEKLSEKAQTAFSCANELASELNTLLSETEYSDELTEKTEERIDLLQKLSSKCSCKPEELFSVYSAFSEEKNTLLKSDESLDELSEKYAEKRTLVTKLAGEIHNSRVKAAEKLSAKMEECLAFLNMPNAKFSAEVDTLTSEKQTKFTKKGTDFVQFLLSANKGEELKPLVKVASGGELSRIILAFKNVLSDGDLGITAVFDEVDTGVSGKAASRVAQMLLNISKSRQIICVTHLPQIAVCADTQYRISKYIQNDRTVSQIELLDENGRIDDICRLIGGENITEETKISAKQLLFQAKKLHN